MEMPGTGTDAEYQQSGAMEASSPSGIISVGSGTGLDSVGFAVPTQILPFMKSYFAFSPFEKAGSRPTEMGWMTQPGSSSNTTWRGA